MVTRLTTYILALLVVAMAYSSRLQLEVRAGLTGIVVFLTELAAAPPAHAAAVEPAGPVVYLRRPAPEPGFVFPVTAGARVSSGFGPRSSPFSGRREWHEGLDIAVPVGSPVRAVAGGLVTVAKKTRKAGWVVEIRHGSGFSSRYKHLSALYVVEGDQVDGGRVIGLSGGAPGTGRTTGPHLHLEVVRNPGAHPVDPRRFLKSVEK